MTNRNKGNKVYSMVGVISYIVTTAISAFLNIYLFMNLDPSWKWFTMCMSLSLEALKAYVLIRANTYRSLKEYLINCKLEFKKVAKKMYMYYGFYVFFAVLSITAGLMFSLNISDKTEQGFAIERQAIVQNISSLTESREKYTAALEKFTNLQDNSDENEKLAREEMWKAEDAYKKAGNDLDSFAEKIMQRDGITLQKARQTSEYQNYRNQEIDYDSLSRNYQRAKEDYESIQKGTALARAQSAYEAAESEFRGKESLFGSLDDLNLQLSELNKKEIAAAGSSKGFILLAQTFGIPEKVKQVKFFILLLASLLIELGIWISSPDLRLDGNLLYTYRNDIGLTNKKDADKLFKEIEDTNKRYSVKEEEVKIIEKDTPKTLKELENLKEQISVLEREKKADADSIRELKELINDLVDPVDAIAWENMQNELEENYAILEYEIPRREQAEKDLERAENAFAKVCKMLKEEKDLRNISDENAKYYIYESDNLKKKIEELEKRPVQDESKKYSEEDLQKLLTKASKKSKEKIEQLTQSLSNFEAEYQKVSDKLSNLEITNKSLEKELKESQAKEEIDQVLNGEITNSEIDSVLEESKNKKQEEIVKPAEEQLEEMLKDLTDGPKVVKINV